MRKQRFGNIARIAIATLIMLFLVTSQIAVADTFVWGDDFDDGNYDGWTVQTGALAVTNGVLVATEDPDVTEEQNFITRESSVEMGTWTFDVRLVSNIRTNIFFMLAGVGTGEVWSSKSIAVALWYSGTYGQMDLFRFSGTGGGNYFQIGETYQPLSMDSLCHVRVIRNATNYFYAYLNDTLVIEGFAAVEVVDYTHFGFMGDYQCGIDNITVSEYEEPTSVTTTTTTSTTTTTEPPPPPPPPIDPMPLLAVGSVAVVAVIVIVLLFKMRS